MIRGAGVIVCAALIAVPVSARAQSRVISPNNKHNLSTSGPGPVKATGETQVCVFCHTPHNSNPAAPLWNQSLSTGVTYQAYTSTTLQATVGLPTGSSKLCLSCHDGTVAIGSTIMQGLIAMQGVGAGGKLTGASVIGPNLTTSHPVSFSPVTRATLVNPPANSPVKLDANGQVQCRTCHDPHQMDVDTTTNKFLVMSNSASGLCVVCHQQLYWASNPSSHMTSTKSYAAAQGAHTGYSTVATNGCESCHKPHNAAVAQRGLKALEEKTCGSGATQCHSSSGIGRNIEAEFAKAYQHPTYSVSPSVHDAAESPTHPLYPLPETSATTARHAECPDCHNAHASYAASASAPKGSGKVAGVWGINSAGGQVLPSGVPASVNEYEICYKCHADSKNLPQAAGGPYGPYPNRSIVQWNKRTEFDPANVSYHPIAAASKAAAAPSILAPWTLTSIIKCTDCHDNDTGPKAPTPGTGPSGPHGSSIKHLLVARYDADTSSTTESAATYALCYKCHNRTIVLSSTSFSGHNHAIGQRGSCSFCHDPHGVPQGNTTNNKFLINLDTRFLTPSGGILRIDDLGGGSVRCYMVCHGENHNGRTCSKNSCG